MPHHHLAVKLLRFVAVLRHLVQVSHATVPSKPVDQNIVDVMVVSGSEIGSAIVHEKIGKYIISANTNMGAV